MNDQTVVVDVPAEDLISPRKHLAKIKETGLLRRVEEPADPTFLAHELQGRTGPASSCVMTKAAAPSLEAGVRNE